MAVAPAIILHLFLILQFSSSDPGPSPPSPASDAAALLLFKSSFDNAPAALASWNDGNSSEPCNSKTPWTGVQCSGGAVSGLRLSRMGLAGGVNVDAIASLKALRILRLSHNALSGTIPSLDRLPALRAVYLSHNRFTGPIPEGMFNHMTRLKKLWLDHNAFTGDVPYSLSKAKNLKELRLEDNKFSGTIPALVFMSLSSFNVSNNDLSGSIPESFAKFDAGSFVGNNGLCGLQLGNDSCGSVVGLPGQRGAMAAVCVGLLVVACIAIFGLAACKKSGSQEFETLGVDRGMPPAETSPPPPPQDYEKGLNVNEGHHKREPSWGNDNKPPSEPGHKRTGSSTKGGRGGGEAGGGGGAADLVIVNEGKGVFGMPDLMKAAAEVMGSGGLGSAYKAVMANGVAVVVKRMKDMNRVGKEAFDLQMRKLGRLNHRNVLPPLAFHYRKDEKLLIYEYIPKGSLLFVLHGDRGPDHAALNWPTRLKIARGVANGLSYLLTELGSDDVPHGNLKSGNVLLAPDFEPLLVDYGFMPLVNPSQASNAMMSHRSPESFHDRRVSPKSDVYCLGVLLLELLTGKFPSQYMNNTKGGTDVVHWATTSIAEQREAEILDPAIVAGAKASVGEMKRLVRVAVDCVEPDPEQRINVKEAAQRIDEVAAAEKERERNDASGGGHTAYVRGGGGAGERSARRAGSIDKPSARLSDDKFEFGIS